MNLRLFLKQSTDLDKNSHRIISFAKQDRFTSISYADCCRLQIVDFKPHLVHFHRWLSWHILTNCSIGSHSTSLFSLAYSLKERVSMLSILALLSFYSPMLTDLPIDLTLPVSLLVLLFRYPLLPFSSPVRSTRLMNCRYSRLPTNCRTFEFAKSFIDVISIIIILKKKTFLRLYF